jgi:hypothetical protein
VFVMLDVGIEGAVSWCEDMLFWRMPLVEIRARCGPDSIVLNGRRVFQLVVTLPRVMKLPPNGALCINGLLRSQVPVEHN